MEEPQFPTRCSPHFEDSTAPLGNFEEWETSYQGTNHPFSNVERIEANSNNTAALQRSHWQPGTEKTEMISESQAQYHKLPPAFRRPVGTRNQLMASHILMDDGSRMETRESLSQQKAVTIQNAQTDQNTRKNLARSHFSLSDDSCSPKDQWMTTNQAMMQYNYIPPSSPSTLKVCSGEGAKVALSGSCGFGSYQTESKSKYVDFKNFSSSVPASPPKETLEIGDNRQTIYETTSQSAYKKLPIVAEDPSKARSIRAALYKSGSLTGNEPFVSKSTYGATFIDHMANGYKPLGLGERTAFISHHDFRNYEGNDQFHTTTEEALKPKQILPTRAVDNHLRQSHIIIGQPGYSETQSLYQQTFKQHDLQEAHRDAMKINLSTHHMRDLSVNNGPMESTSHASYVAYPGFKPSEPIHFEQIEHVITPSDPSFTVIQSTSQASYVPFKTERVKPLNNQLQVSHIKFGGMQDEKWTTSGADYFQYTTFKMPKKA